MNLTEKILRVMKSTGKPMNANQIHARLEAEKFFVELQSVAVTLCAMKKRNLLDDGGNHKCEACGSSRHTYRLTEDAKVRLAS